TLARAGTKHLRAKARDVETCGGRGDHLDGATGEAEGHRPDSGLARPVEDVVYRAYQEILFKLVLQPAHSVLSRYIIGHRSRQWHSQGGVSRLGTLALTNCCSAMRWAYTLA